MPTVVVNGVTVYFREAGDGEGVLLLHSTSSSGGQWKLLMESMSPRYRLVSPDLFGYGRTPHWPDNRADLIEDEVGIAKAMMERVARPVHVVGHSYGGHIAARVTLSCPDQVRSLTLIEPAMHYLLAQCKEEQAYAEIRSVADAVLALIRGGDLEKAASIFLDYWVAPGALAEMHPDRRAAVVETMHKLVYEWPFSLIRNEASIAELRTLVTPTLLISGTRTTFALGRLMELLRQTLPNCDFVSIEGAGHMSPITHADQVNSVVAAHIRQHGQSGA